MPRQIITAKYLKLSVLEKRLNELFGVNCYTRPRAVNGIFELDIPQLLTDEEIRYIQDMSFPTVAVLM
ncbi:hypothetical protein BZA05DRAFT_448412 [Tricharina praecox]|uniref:uncharacterized protein n=1 Tax=Tricharina praecox TaxID=43433 RepID=UPI00221F1D6D|nr:uncharacterized protein BZA05DRAFT_448412 [Tricharina praecox]KAI5844327.1 hypothetical protein BZA05DRAFT_448412 [Tricharina praecox]